MIDRPWPSCPAVNANVWRLPGVASRPKILLLDEPLSALDAKLRESMQVEIRQLQQRLNITTIMVTRSA